MKNITKFFFFWSWLLVPFLASASEKMVVTPAFQDIVLEAGQSTKSQIEIKNQTGTDQQFSVRSVSFRSLDTSGGVAFLGAEINEKDLPSAEFISFENKSLDIPAGETRTFSFEVRDFVALEPGGHYAAVVFQSLPVTNEDVAQKVAVRQIFSSLVFLEKKGGEVKSLELKKLPEQSFLWSFPKSIELSFVNTGNTHLVPRGTLEVQGMFRHMVARTVLNETSSILLPGQERLFPVTLSYQPWLPGFYTTRVTYRHDGIAEERIMEERVFILPYRFVGAAGIVAVLLLLLRRWVKRLEKNKKRSVSLRMKNDEGF